MIQCYNNEHLGEDKSKYWLFSEHLPALQQQEVDSRRVDSEGEHANFRFSDKQCNCVHIRLWLEAA